MLHAISLPLSRWHNWRQGWQDAFLSTEVFQDIAEKYWGNAKAGDLSIIEGKALAAKKIQDYGYIKESLIVCDLVWPIYQVRNVDKDIGLATLESQIVSAITGRQLDEEELMRTGERNFNMQRAVLVRQGRSGREGDVLMDYLFNEPLHHVFFDPECRVPGADGRLVSKKGVVLNREEFERLKDEYYTLRGWDVESGLQTETKLNELELADIDSDLKKRGLLR